MIIVMHFLLGFISSFIGSLTPSMLNMSALKVSIEKGKKAAFWFSVGVSSVVLIQAYIAVLLTKYIMENPMIIEWLERAAVIIFIVLSIFFYLQSKKSKQEDFNKPQKTKSKFILGVFLSILNMFAIPFYFGITTTFDMLGWINFKQTNILLFILGSALGTLGILFIYVKYSRIIQLKAGRFTKDINLVLSFLTGLVAIFTLLKFFI